MAYRLAARTTIICDTRVAPPPRRAPPTGAYDDQGPWWRHEQMHRAVLYHHAARATAIITERDAVDAGFQARIAAARSAPTEALKAVVGDCWGEAEARGGRLVGTAREPCTVKAAIKPASSQLGAVESCRRLTLIGVAPLKSA